MRRNPLLPCRFKTAPPLIRFPPTNRPPDSVTRMSLTAAKVKKRLKEFTNPEKAAFFPRFFKAGKGEYAEGDRFLGVTVPHQRKVAREFKQLSIEELKKLLHDPFHECRMTSLLILVLQFEKGDEGTRRNHYHFFLRHIRQVNHWDLVDASAHKIVGAYLEERPRKKLYQLASSGHLWSQRVAIVSTYWFLRKHDFADTLAIADRFLEHEHDLIHKAVGWMLRELGKRNETMLVEFLGTRYRRMPRTMLRYAIEKFSPSKRESYLRGNV